tara:strand:- start:18896 stop:19627 length:732 start_codon:yes stop_codon:yes gene_type:complete
MLNSPETLGQGAIDIILEGLNDSNLQVIENYIFSLQRIGRAYGLRVKSSDSTVQSPIEIPEALKERLFDNIIQPQSEHIGFQSAIAAMLVMPADLDLVDFIVNNVLNNEFYADQKLYEIIPFLNTGKEFTAAYKNWLLKQVSSSSQYLTAVNSALALRGQSEFPPELLPGIIELLQRESDYANINLLQIIGEFEDARLYKKELIAIKSKLQQEMLLPAEERAIQYSTADYTLQYFNELLESLN